MTSNPIAEHKKPMTLDTVQMLFIDHQPEIVANSNTNPVPDLTKATVALAKIAKLFDIPVTVSCVPVGPEKPKLIPELEALLADAPRFTRTMAPVFDDKPTAEHIEGLGRHDLVVCGVVTEVAVLLAAFMGVSLGHEVHVPVDACGGYSSRTEDAAFRRIESFGAATAAVATLGAVLQPDLGSEKGQQMMSILQTVTAA